MVAVGVAEEKDPATNQYNFSIDERREKLFVMERYADAAGFFAHTQTLGPYAARYFEKIEVVSHSRVRRAKLYYLRGRRGKAARLKELRLP